MKPEHEKILEEVLIEAMSEISPKSILESNERIGDMYDNDDITMADIDFMIDNLKQRMIL